MHTQDGKTNKNHEIKHEKLTFKRKKKIINKWTDNDDNKDIVIKKDDDEKDFDKNLPIILFLGNRFYDSSDSEERKYHSDSEIKNISPSPKNNNCPGINCDHDINSNNVPPIPEHLNNVNQGYKLTLYDLIELGKAYHCQRQKKYRMINLEMLAKMTEPLEKLYNVIGMRRIKEEFVQQIVYFLVDMKPNPTEMLHTRLEGPPGVGKTFITEILAEIYLKIGYLKSNKIIKVKLTDLKGKFVGHSGKLTQDAIDSALGGVLILDEAYMLGHEEKIDSFSKEIIDTINLNLTENAGKFVMIIAGYTEELEKCFFNHNPGLRSRFRFRFTIDGYDYRELADIFIHKVLTEGWNFDDDMGIDQLYYFFGQNQKSFMFFGRSIETLFFYIKMAHSNRALFGNESDVKKINMADFLEGFEKYRLHNNHMMPDNYISESIRAMYL